MMSLTDLCTRRLYFRCPQHADPEQFANTALKTKILKDKGLAHNDDVQAALADKLSANLVAPQDLGSSAAKVHGRLLSSKVLAEAVHAVVDTLREVLDPSLAKGKAHAKKGANGEADADDSADEDEESAVERSSKKARLVEESDEEEDEDEAEEDSDVEVDDAGWESGTIDGGDGAGWESGTVDDGDDAVVGSSDEDEDEEEEDDSEDHSEDDSDDAPIPQTKAATKDAKSKSKTTGGESTFLPSLSVGFTRGDSDASDISDGEADAPRKNRRGQRARRAYVFLLVARICPCMLIIERFYLLTGPRRAPDCTPHLFRHTRIWEKKYGKNANHVKKQQAEQKSRQQRRDGPRGASGGGPGKPQWQARGAGGAPPRLGSSKPFVAPQKTDGGWAGRTAGPGAGANKAGAAKEEKALHPSWEAKRKLKEKLNPGILPAQGKKIKFS